MSQQQQLRGWWPSLTSRPQYEQTSATAASQNAKRFRLFVVPLLQSMNRNWLRRRRRRLLTNWGLRLVLPADQSSLADDCCPLSASIIHGAKDADQSSSNSSSSPNDRS